MLTIRYLLMFLMLYAQSSAVYCMYGDDGYSYLFEHRTDCRLNGTVVNGPKTTPFSSQTTFSSSPDLDQDFEDKFLQLTVQESFVRGDVQREYRDTFNEYFLALRHFVHGQGILERTIGQRRLRDENSSMTEPLTESACFSQDSPLPSQPGSDSTDCTNDGRARWRYFEQNK